MDALFNIRLLVRSLQALVAEIRTLREALRDKGVKYFLRPLACVGFFVLVSHHFLYAPPRQKLAALSSELEAVQSTVHYAADYQDLRGRLDGFYARLPHTSEPAAWLLSEIRESLRQEGIVPNSFSSPTTETKTGYRLVSLTVILSTGYRQLASWIARLESSKSFLHVRELTVLKKPKPIGTNTATVTIVTIAPMEEAR